MKLDFVSQNLSTWTIICKSMITFIVLSWMTAGLDAIRCFCDSTNCDRDNLCTGRWCIVGFKSDVKMEQRCSDESGSEMAECKRGWDGWEEVCSCQNDFCNTFSFLRYQLQRMERQPNVRTEQGRGTHGQGGTQLGGYGTQVRDVEDDGYPPLNYQYRSNTLVILLVVIPLGVGAAAVCLIFVNYHCKMC